jgi:hypothetical protein
MEIPLILVSGRARLDYAQDWEIKPQGDDGLR